MILSAIRSTTDTKHFMNSILQTNILQYLTTRMNSQNGYTMTTVLLEVSLSYQQTHHDFNQTRYAILMYVTNRFPGIETYA